MLNENIRYTVGCSQLPFVFCFYANEHGDALGEADWDLKPETLESAKEAAKQDAMTKIANSVLCA